MYSGYFINLNETHVRYQLVKGASFTLWLSNFTRKPGCFTAANYRDLSRVISVSFRDVWGPSRGGYKRDYA